MAEVCSNGGGLDECAHSVLWVVATFAEYKEEEEEEEAAVVGVAARLPTKPANG